MTRNKCFLLVIAGFFLLALGLIQTNSKSSIEEQIHSLSELLSGNIVTEAVFFDGKEYRVTDGNIEPQPPIISDRDRLQLLRLAYAKSYLLRNSVLSLPATNLVAFDQQVEELESLAEDLSDIQTSWLSRLLVRNFLYPVNFLKSLSVAESMRREFLSEGSKENLDNYNQALEEVYQSYLKDSRRFTLAYKLLLFGERERFVTNRYLITKENSLATFTSLQERYDDALSKQALFSRCLLGYTNECPDLSFDLKVESIAQSDQSAPPQIVLEYYRALQERNELSTIDWTFKDNTVYQLQASQCLNNSDTAWFAFSSGGPRPLMELSNVRLLLTEEFSDVPFYQYFTEYDIEYVPLSPMTHYACPDVGTDIGTAGALKRVQEIVRTEPLSHFQDDPRGKAQLHQLELGLSSTTVSEYVASSYLSELNTLDLPEGIEASYFDILSGLEEKNASSEEILRSIVETERVNLQSYQQGMPVNLGAQHLYFTRSGFMTFSLIPSFINRDINLFQPSTLVSADRPYYTLDELIKAGHSLEDIASDVYLYNALHYTSTTSINRTDYDD